MFGALFTLLSSIEISTMAGWRGKRTSNKNVNAPSTRPRREEEYSASSSEESWVWEGEETRKYGHLARENEAETIKSRKGKRIVSYQEPDDQFRPDRGRQSWRHDGSRLHLGGQNRSKQNAREIGVETPRDWRGKRIMNYQEPDDRFRPNHGRHDKPYDGSRLNRVPERWFRRGNTQKYAPQKWHSSSYPSTIPVWREVQKTSTTDSAHLRRPRREEDYSASRKEENSGWDEGKVGDAEDMNRGGDVASEMEVEMPKDWKGKRIMNYKESGDRYRSDRRSNKMAHDGSRLNLGGQSRSTQKAQEKKHSNQELKTHKKSGPHSIPERMSRGDTQKNRSQSTSYPSSNWEWRVVQKTSTVDSTSQLQTLQQTPTVEVQTVADVPVSGSNREFLSPANTRSPNTTRFSLDDNFLLPRFNQFPQRRTMSDPLGQNHRRSLSVSNTNAPPYFPQRRLNHSIARQPYQMLERQPGLHPIIYDSSPYLQTAVCPFHYVPEIPTSPIVHTMPYNQTESHHSLQLLNHGFDPRSNTSFQLQFERVPSFNPQQMPYVANHPSPSLPTTSSLPLMHRPSSSRQPRLVPVSTAADTHVMNVLHLRTPMPFTPFYAVALSGREVISDIGHSLLPRTEDVAEGCIPSVLFLNFTVAPPRHPPDEAGLHAPPTPDSRVDAAATNPANSDVPDPQTEIIEQSGDQGGL